MIPLDHRGSGDRQTWQEINDRVLDWKALCVSGAICCVIIVEAIDTLVTEAANRCMLKSTL